MLRYNFKDVQSDIIYFNIFYLLQQASSSRSGTPRTSPLHEPHKYDPIVNTCVKPSYEVDDTGMWNFCKGDDIYKEDIERYIVKLLISICSVC